MSSHSSREYYYTSSEAPNHRSMSARESLPPLRSVLGAQLDLPVQSTSGSGSYDLREMSKALPRSSLSSQSTSDYRTSARSQSSYASYADRDRDHDRQSYSQYQRGTSNYSSQRTHHVQPHDSYGHHHTSSQSHGYYQNRSRTPAYDESEHIYGSSDLSRTDRTHGNKKYACTWPGCDKRFERQNALDTHMNIHTDQKPYACPVEHCGKVFNVRSNMRRHLLTHKDYQMEEEDYRPMSSRTMKF